MSLSTSVVSFGKPPGPQASGSEPMKLWPFRKREVRDLQVRSLRWTSTPRNVGRLRRVVDSLGKPYHAAGYECCDKLQHALRGWLVDAHRSRCCRGGRKPGAAGCGKRQRCHTRRRHCLTAAPPAQAPLCPAPWWRRTGSCRPRWSLRCCSPGHCKAATQGRRWGRRFEHRAWTGHSRHKQLEAGVVLAQQVLPATGKAVGKQRSRGEMACRPASFGMCAVRGPPAAAHMPVTAPAASHATAVHEQTGVAASHPEMLLALA